MSDFSGRLSIISNQSSLDNDLLLMTGIPDAAQAIFAATQFLVKSRHLSSGQRIIVTGDKGTFGDAGIIVMTDARADPAQPFALPLVAASAESLSALINSAAASTPAREESLGERAGEKSAGKPRSRSKDSGRGAKAKKRALARGSSKK